MIPLIPPLLVNNNSRTDFKEKASLFNGFFSKQCIPAANDSTLRSLLENLNETLSSFEITESVIGKIFKKVNVNKAHGHDKISIWIIWISHMQTTWSNFEELSQLYYFPNVWKKEIK